MLKSILLTCRLTEVPTDINYNQRLANLLTFKMEEVKPSPAVFISHNKLTTGQLV